MKKAFKKKCLCAVFFALAGTCYGQQSFPFQNTDLPLDQRIEDLLSRMTLEEKVSQMMNTSPAIERLGIPAYNWWNEALHGVVVGQTKIEIITMGQNIKEMLFALEETFAKNEVIPDSGNRK